MSNFATRVGRLARLRADLEPLQRRLDVRRVHGRAVRDAGRESGRALVPAWASVPRALGDRAALSGRLDVVLPAGDRHSGVGDLEREALAGVGVGHLAGRGPAPPTIAVR